MHPENHVILRLKTDFFKIESLHLYQGSLNQDSESETARGLRVFSPMSWGVRAEF